MALSRANLSLKEIFNANFVPCSAILKVCMENIIHELQVLPFSRVASNSVHSSNKLWHCLRAALQDILSVHLRSKTCMLFTSYVLFYCLTPNVFYQNCWRCFHLQFRELGFILQFLRFLTLYDNTVELQWLKHLWKHEKMFETGIVRANEC